MARQSNLNSAKREIGSGVICAMLLAWGMGCQATVPSSQPPAASGAAQPVQTTQPALPAHLLRNASEPLKGSTATLTVHGLACPLCAKGVDRELRTLPGVSHVEMDVNTGIVRITFDPARPPTRMAVFEAVRWGGAAVIDLRQP